MSFPPHVPEADGVPHHRQEEVQLAAPLLPLGLIPPPLPRLNGGQVGALGVLKYVPELKYQGEMTWQRLQVQLPPHLVVSILASINLSPHVLGLNISSFRLTSLNHHIITCSISSITVGPTVWGGMTPTTPPCNFTCFSLSLWSFVVTQRQTLLQFRVWVLGKLKYGEVGTEKDWSLSGLRASEASFTSPNSLPRIVNFKANG